MRVAFNRDYNDVPHAWHRNNALIINSAANAIRAMLPIGENKGIKLPGIIGIPCEFPGVPITSIDHARGQLPYPDLHLDFVLSCNFPTERDDFKSIAREAFRVLKNRGVFIVAFLDQSSPHCQEYAIAADTENSQNMEEILFQLSQSGFKNFQLVQTLFDAPDEIAEIQRPKTGYGEGSFVVVTAEKKM